MQQTLTAKLQIFPKPSDRQLLFDTTKAYTTKAYSAACTYVSDYVHANHTPLNIFHIQKATYQTCRESFGLRSQMAVSVTRTVIAAYKSVRTNQRQHSGRFSKKKRHIDIKPSFRAPQLSLVWNRDYSLIKNTDKTERLFSVNTLRGRIKCPFRADSMDWAFDEGAVYGTAKLIFRHGKFFLYGASVSSLLPVTERRLPFIPERWSNRNGLITKNSAFSSRNGRHPPQDAGSVPSGREKTVG